MAIDSVIKLTDYCLRKLGAPVINIEVDETQTKDRVNDAVKYFIDRHFDGVEEIYFKKTILPKDVTNGHLTIDGNIVAVTEYLSNDAGSSLEVFDQADYNFMDEYHRNKGLVGTSIVDFYMTQSYINTLNIITGKPNNSYTFNKASNRFVPQDGLTSVGSSNLLSAAVDMADWTGSNATLTVNDVEYVDTKFSGSTITSDAAGIFGITQTINTDYYIRGTFTAQIILKAGTYTGDVILEISDRDGNIVQSETVSPSSTLWKQFFVTGTYAEGNVNDLILTVKSATGAAALGETFIIQSAPSVFANNFVIVKGYKAVDMTEDTEIFEDRWLQLYATAYIKLQWGANLKKYSGQKLPGGLEINGQIIFDEAREEINSLEQEFREQYEGIPDILIG